MTGPAGRVPLAGLLIASGVSLVGNQVTAIALPWLVLTGLGTPFDAGLLGAALVLPAVIGAVGGGVLVDRLGSRATSIVADLASGVCVLAVPVAAATVGLSVEMLVVLAFLGALLDAPGATARQVMIPPLAREAGVSLERANGVYGTVENLSLVGGPLVGGALIVGIGAANVLWLDAASFAVSAAVIALAVPRALAAGSGEAAADVVGGIRLLAQDSVLGALTLVAAVANFAGTPLFIVVLPVLAVSSGVGASALGLMLAAFGLGLVVGSLAYAAVGQRYRRRPVLLASFAITGASLGLVAFVPPFPVLLALLGLAGIASGPVNPIAFTVLQERVPAELRGRVFGAVLGGVLLAAPVGMIAFGMLTEATGPWAGLAAAAIAFSAVAVAISAWGPFRAMDPRPG